MISFKSINMKKLNLLFTLGLAALVMQACHHNNASKIPDPIKEADSTNAINDTPRRDTSAGKQAATVPDDDDARFMVRAASGGMAEVELGKIALSKSHNAGVKSFAAMMVSDHSKANKKLTALAVSDHISLPQFPAKDEEKLSDDLIKKSGDDFDKAYVDAMVKDHQEDIKEFENEIKTAKGADIKALAQSTLPMLQQHLKAIQAIQDSMKHSGK
jgi:putative membrane protein